MPSFDRLGRDLRPALIELRTRRPRARGAEIAGDASATDRTRHAASGGTLALDGTRIAHEPRTPEILVILVVALLVFGPQRLPEVGRQVGAAMRELRKMQDTVRGELDMVLHPEHGTRSSDVAVRARRPHRAIRRSTSPVDVDRRPSADGSSDLTPTDVDLRDDHDAGDADPTTTAGFPGPPDSFI